MQSRRQWRLQQRFLITVSAEEKRTGTRFRTNDIVKQSQSFLLAFFSLYFSFVVLQEADCKPAIYRGLQLHISKHSKK